MKRREFIPSLLLVGFSGCLGTGSDPDGFEEVANETIIDQTTLTLDGNAGDVVRITLENERGFVALIDVYTDTQTLLEDETETQSTFELTLEEDATHFVWIGADERASVVIERKRQ